MPTNVTPNPDNNANQQPAFEEIEHTADWALKIHGRDLRELLINAAQGMGSLLVSNLAGIPTDIEKKIELDSIDAESLLVDWLSELAYWAEVEGLIFRDFTLDRVGQTGLRATVRGAHVSDLTKHIKAVTYHNLEIIQTETGLEATVVFDV